MPPGFASSLRAYNVPSRNFRICLPPEDIVPASAAGAQQALSHPASPRPGELIGDLCGTNLCCPYRDCSGAFTEVLSMRSQTSVRTSIVEMDCKTEIPSLLLRIAGLWPLLAGPRCCGLLDPYSMYWSFCYF